RHGQRQAVVKGIQRSQHDAGIAQLATAAQGRMSEAAASGLLASPPRPLPRFALRLVTEIAADQLQVGANRGSVINQGVRYGSVAADRRLARTEDAGLFKGDLLARVAEKIHMVEIDAGDDGAIRIVDIDRIETAAEADLENDDVEP